MRILFANMPFSAVRPAMGVSLLKGHLNARGDESVIEYFNLRFADLLGGRKTWFISELAPSQMMAGEFVFAGEVFPRLAKVDDRYWDAVSSRFGGVVTARHIEWVKQARAIAPMFVDECYDAVDWPSYDIVGFTTTFNQTLASLALAKRIKSLHPGVMIMFGGANCEHGMGLQLHRSFPEIDFVFTGEADVSFPRVVEALAAGTPLDGIPGVVRRGGGGESQFLSLYPERVRSLDPLPYPDFDDFYEQFERVRPYDERPGAVMETSRGCWWGEKHHCTFCGVNGLSMSFRSKGAERALAEVVFITQRYKTNKIEMVDNILDMRYLRTFLPLLRSSGADVDLFYETKANLTRDQLVLMRTAGISAIQPGIESLSTAVLQRMDKGITGIQNVQLLKWCRELGIKPHWNLLYGFPGEDPEEYLAFARLAELLHHLDPPQAAFAIRLDRFSPHFDRAAQFGLVNVRPDRMYEYVFDLDAEAIHELSYYFEHDYADGRDVETYGSAAVTAVARWRDAAPASALTMRREDDAIVVTDRRDGRFEEHELSSAASRAFAYAAAARPIDKVVRRAAESGIGTAAARRVVASLVDDGLAVAMDGRLLSLAVAADLDASEATAAPARSRVRVL